MRNVIISFIFLLLIIVMIISSYFIYIFLEENHKQEQIFFKLSKIIEIEDKLNNNNIQIEKENINIMELYSINKDIVAWIKIENSNINYPIMHTKEKPNYYLRRNFYKEYSYSGTPYLSENCDIEKSDNLIIHGHNLDGKKMFGELEKYKNEKYYRNHKKIEFYTLNEKQEYEIFAVFKTTINSNFKYYNIINFNNEREFDMFYKKCKELSFYNIDEEAKYGDKFITLSTCEYSSENGRFVVVARKNM